MAEREPDATFIFTDPEGLVQRELFSTTVPTEQDKFIEGLVEHFKAIGVEVTVTPVDLNSRES